VNAIEQLFQRLREDHEEGDGKSAQQEQVMSAYEFHASIDGTA
jgi:hypothetical protein